MKNCKKGTSEQTCVPVPDLSISSNDVGQRCSQAPRNLAIGPIDLILGQQRLWVCYFVFTVSIELIFDNSRCFAHFTPNLTSGTVKLIRNLIQSQFVFPEFGERKMSENKKLFLNKKVETKSFRLVPVRAPNSK